MMETKNIWEMLLGVVFFLLAMAYMENTLGKLAGRKFKLFLKRNLNNRFKSITGSAVVTSILQSSSIVNLLVLSLVGSGVVHIENALGLLLGSNIGTTVNSWIVVTFGFQLNMQHLILPIAGIAGILMLFLKKESTWQLWCTFLFSLALLFIGLNYIKLGMENFVLQTDLAAFLHYPLFFYLFLGVLLTAIVQSSAATIAITLSALYANAITLPIAMCIILGGEIGTTLKLFLAAAKGIAAKKRIALANFIINTVTVLLIFLLLQPIYLFITRIVGIENNLIALVFFQSFLNLVSILLFAPFLKRFAKFLETCYTNKNKTSLYINKVALINSKEALQAFEKETKHFIIEVLEYSAYSLALREDFSLPKPESVKNEPESTMEPYEKIKYLHGEIVQYYFGLNKIVTKKGEKERLEQLIDANRNMMYAAKNIQDAKADIVQTSNSSNTFKYNFYKDSRLRALHFYEKCVELLNPGKSKQGYRQISELLESVTLAYTETVQFLYQEGLTKQINQIEISTLINFNRELFTSFKSILFGLKNYLLNKEEADQMELLPGFIR